MRGNAVRRFDGVRMGHPSGAVYEVFDPPWWRAWRWGVWGWRRYCERRAAAILIVAVESEAKRFVWALACRPAPRLEVEALFKPTGER